MHDELVAKINSSLLKKNDIDINEFLKTKYNTDKSKLQSWSLHFETF